MYIETAHPFSRMDVFPVVIAIAAILPGFSAWWTGRAVVKHLEDPALPELLFARRQRLTTATAAGLAVIVVVGGDFAFWAIPLMVLSLPIGGYSLRRALGVDTSGVVVHTWRHVKSLVGSLGFWVLLAWTPQIVFAIDPRVRLAALALVPILLAWDHWYHRVWLFLHDAEPLVDEALAARLAAIDERAGIAGPALYRIGLPGTRYVNAFALPSARQPSIILGNALIDLLEPDEVAAIYAHELSHIEQHSPRRMRRAQLVNRVLILAAVALPFAVLWVSPGAAHWAAIFWPFAVLAALIVRGRDRKTHETESDLRAAALCGDADVVARALIKVHTHALIPRRWAVDVERGATHPSLARRIQMLRGETAAAAAAAPNAPIILPTAREGSVVAFDDARAYWFDGVPAGTPNDLDALRTHATSARSVAWPELLELRVTAAATERALQASHRNGDKWSVPLDPAHVADVQRALDRVDVRLHRELGKRQFPDARVIATLVLLTIVASADFGIVVIPAMLAAIRPGAASLAALGAMSVASALIGLVRDSPLDTTAAARTAALLVLGAVGLWRAWVRSRSPSGETTRRGSGSRETLVVLGGVVAIIGVLLALAVRDLSLAQIAQLPLLTTLTMAFAGLAGALLMDQTRRTKMAAAVIGLGAVTVAIPTFASSGMWSATTRLTRSTATAAEVGRIALPRSAVSTQPSPNGRRFLVRTYDRADPSLHFSLRSLGGAQREIAALQAEFGDDDHVLTLRDHGDTLALRLESADSGVVVWTIPLPEVIGPRLVVAPTDRTWSVVGTNDEEDSLTVISGSVDSRAITVRRFPSLGTLGTAAVIVGSRVITPAYDIAQARPGIAGLLALMNPRARLYELTETGRRQIAQLDGFPQCGAGDRARVTCLIRQRARTEIWTLADTGGPTRAGSLPLVDVTLATLGSDGRVAAVERGKVAIIDPAARRITDVTIPDDPGYAVEAHSGVGFVSVLRRSVGGGVGGTAGGSTLIVYRLQ